MSPEWDGEIAMKRNWLLVAGMITALAVLPSLASAEILAMLNYESKPTDSLKAFKHPVAGKIRREGIAIIDVDPQSENFGKILMDMPLPSDLVAHHIFYGNRMPECPLTFLPSPL